MSGNPAEAETYISRQKSLAEYLEKNRISAAVLRDFDGSRNSSVRYLTGHPEDALLFVFSTGESILVPWDIILAENSAHADRIIPYADFNRSYITAVKKIAGEIPARISPDSAGAEYKIEISSASPYPEVLQLAAELPDAEIICKKEGFELFLESRRTVKDESELKAVREAAVITNEILDRLDNYVRSEKEITETDIAFFIEKLARGKGGEGTGFKTIAASPGRSWGIHPYPSYTNASMRGKGLSIIDFGIRHSGYTTDVTAGIACGPLSRKQEEIVLLVEEAVSIAESFLTAGTGVKIPAQEVNAFFSSRGYAMPHSLGHGIGLDVHEKPFIKDSEDGADVFRAGMIIAIEPGLYLPEEGGIRLENNYLLTETGFEKLTSSRIFRRDQA